MRNPKNVIGITTTVPSEVLLAAGFTPLDLNNIFINSPSPGQLVRNAERAGFPINTCAWIKGIYSVCLEHHINTVLCVTTGDCSNTSMLMEVLKLRGINTIPFAYPNCPSIYIMQSALSKLANNLGTTLEASENMRHLLSPCRAAACELDRITWEGNRISGAENHYWLVSSSDFNQNHMRYHTDIQSLIDTASQRQPYSAGELRLAFIGVPPVYGKDLYQFIEQNGARVVYNEIQRQFAMPYGSGTLAEQYTDYTYPYGIEKRICDISHEIERRSIDGIIHYVQAFCHRAIGDIVFRSHFSVPIITIEGNTDFDLSQHLKTRLEAFLDILAQTKIKPSAT